MSELRRNAWHVLAVTLPGCAVLFLGLWIYLLSTLCASPRAPDAATGNVIACNCHGTVVFISRTQDILLFGLIPALLVAGLCGRAARKRAGPPSGEVR
jgi:hypothetical protein